MIKEKSIKPHTHKKPWNDLKFIVSEISQYEKATSYMFPII